MPPIRDQFCSACGTAYVAREAYPRRCPEPACGLEVWANPIPVAVTLVPVIDGARTGLLVVRRGIEPGRGRLALVGGRPQRAYAAVRRHVNAPPARH
jgi:8-oxo-dGTP diphosphatase